MAKQRKRKPRSVNRENYSPLLRLTLNQSIKSTELRLSGEELETFKQMSLSEKRDVVLKASEKKVDTEIIDYFKQLNSE